MKQTTAADGTVTSTDYTLDGYVAKVTFSDQTVSYTYDEVGNRVSMTDKIGTTVWSYDWANRTLSEKDAQGKASSYGYDLVGNLVQTKYPDGRTLNRVFDGRGLAQSQSGPTGVTGFGYDADGDLASITRPSGVSTTVTRDLMGRVTQIVHGGSGVVGAPLPNGEVNPSSGAPGNAFGHCKAGGNGHPNQQPSGCWTNQLVYAYTYDDRGLVSDRSVMTDGTTTTTQYTHDALGRLVGSTSGSLVSTYGWDASSNLVAETVSDDVNTNLALDGSVTVRTVDAVNRTLTVVTDTTQLPDVHTTTTTYSYDARGNRVGEVTERTTGGVTHTLNTVSYGFDGMNQLVSLLDTGANQTNANDDATVAWLRDGLGRALTVTQNGVTLTRVFDGVNVVADGGTRVTRTPDGLPLSEAFEVVVGNGKNAKTVTDTRDILTDLLGTTVAIANGGVINADLTVLGDFGGALRTPGWDTVTGFTGNVETATLVEFASRAYDPQARTWIQEDTIAGSVTRSSSMNKFTYVEGAPETFTDVFGFYRAAAAMAAQTLSASQYAAFMAELKNVLANPVCFGYGCFVEIQQAQAALAAKVAADRAYSEARSAMSPTERANRLAAINRQFLEEQDDIRKELQGLHIYNGLRFAGGMGVGILQGAASIVFAPQIGAYKGIKCLWTWDECQAQSQAMRDDARTFFGDWWDAEQSAFDVLQGDKSFEEHWNEEASGFIRDYTYGDFKDNLDTGNYYGAGKQAGDTTLTAALIVVPAGLALRATKLANIKPTGATAPVGGVAAQAEIGANGTATLTVADLNSAQLANLKRYNKKLPAAAEQTVITAGENGAITFTTKVPGIVPGSYASYVKTVDQAATTIGYFKITVAPDGTVISVKDKLVR